MVGLWAMGRWLERRNLCICRRTSLLLHRGWVIGILLQTRIACEADWATAMSLDLNSYACTFFPSPLNASLRGRGNPRTQLAPPRPSPLQGQLANLNADHFLDTPASYLAVFGHCQYQNVTQLQSRDTKEGICVFVRESVPASGLALPSWRQENDRHPTDSGW